MFCVILVFVMLNQYSYCKIVSLETNGTTILGRELETIFKKRIYTAFYKIPYAEIPVGHLRFKPPKIRPWFTEKTYNYSKPLDDVSLYTEDCLYLSLYMPSSENRIHDYAVVVWLHENSDLQGPDFLIDEDIIVITVSFRTSIVGFLNTEDDFAKGNMAAKDILLSLKWIRNNIIYFNGDPNRVTVIGSGVAANIVASFLLSPLAEDLFARAVIQSGSALNPSDYHSFNFEILNKLFWKFYGPTKMFNRNLLYERLLNASIKELNLISKNLFDSTEVRNRQRLINDFGLSVETSRKGAFIDETPIEMYKKGRINKNVQVMMGFTTLESIYKLEGFVNNKKLLTYLNYNFQYLLPFDGRKDEYGSRRYKEIRRKIMDFYFVNGTIRERSLRRYSKYLSDQVIYPVLRQSRLHTETSRNHVYLYRFSFKGSLNVVWDTKLSNLNLTGATAGDEICYQFRCKYLTDIYNTIGENERYFIRKMSRLLANFAKYGNPTPDAKDKVLDNIKWRSLQPSNVEVLNLGRQVRMAKLPERRRMEFWDSLQDEFFTEEKLRDEL